MPQGEQNEEDTNYEYHRVPKLDIYNDYSVKMVSKTLSHIEKYSYTEQINQTSFTDEDEDEEQMDVQDHYDGAIIADDSDSEAEHDLMEPSTTGYKSKSYDAETLESPYIPSTCPAESEKTVEVDKQVSEEGEYKPDRIQSFH